ncbi:MAG: hypothetical protein WCX97_05185 [Candidatus Magasanikbacteria bacterium]
MAKKETAKKEAVKYIGVVELAEKFGIEGRKLRIMLRNLGLVAPRLEGVEGFGPRSKYTWVDGSKELNELIKKLTPVVEAFKARQEAIAEHVVQATKKQKKAPKHPSTEEESEEEDEDDEEYEEEEIEDEDDDEEEED